MVKERIKQKNFVIQKLRKFLLENDFIEINTPIIRRSTSKPFPRIRISCKEEAYLRDSMEMALRYNLSYIEKIFEIGQCFRDENGTSHLNEFIMLELYFSNGDINALISLSEQIIQLFFPKNQIEKISVSEIIKETLHYDLSKESEENFIKYLRENYNDKNSKNYEIVNKYIKDKIEPLSKEKIVLFYDYPICTISQARRKPNTVSIINRFELFINELEIIHGYEDEDNIEDFINRSQKVNLYNYEEKLVVNAIKNKFLPQKTAGLGIGIERLCMALYEVNDIKEFFFSSKF